VKTAGTARCAFARPTELGYGSRMKRIPLLTALLLAFIGTSTIAGAAKLSAADTAWIGKCMDQLKRDNANKTVLRKYCVCMHGYFDDNADVSQSDMEHMFPPAHRLCKRQSSWK
jgi:hypothetical protein